MADRHLRALGREITFGQVQVRAAYSAAGDADPDIAGTRLRIRTLDAT